MNILVERDTTGMAPPACRYSAIDTDWYDGAEDSSTRSHIGYGATEAAAVAALFELMRELER